MTTRRLLLATMLGLFGACARHPADATPEGALDLFLRSMEETPYDPQAGAHAFALLAPPAREAIRREAQRAQQITGKPATPESMFTPTWTPLRFPVDRTHAVVDSDGVHAIVDVYGLEPATQHVRVPMVREGEGWRLDVEVPPAPAVAPSASALPSAE
jgi:hypothetical protein